MTQVFAVMAVFGMACLVWLAYGWLLLPGRCPVRAEVLAEGSGEGLEQRPCGPSGGCGTAACFRGLWPSGTMGWTGKGWSWPWRWPAGRARSFWAAGRNEWT